MQNVIFPMRTINITQRALDSFSHKNLEAWDIAGADTGIESAYAPCRVKVLAKLPYETTGFSNTVFFGSCDKNGNPEAVRTENGEVRVLTFAMTHDNDISDINPGTVYESGEAIYQEGTKGNATGNHIHLEVAEGWQYKKVKRKDGVWETPNITHIADVFFKLKDWNTVKKANGYLFKEVSAREESADGLYTISDAMKAFQYVAGKTSLTETELKKYDINADGKVNISDAMQIFQIVSGKKKMYKLYIVKDGIRIRETLTFKDGKPSGKILRTLPVGSTLTVLELYPEIQADGFQWLKTNYDDIIGYSQYDPECYTLEEV